MRTMMIRRGTVLAVKEKDIERFLSEGWEIHTEDKKVGSFGKAKATAEVVEDNPLIEEEDEEDSSMPNIEEGDE